MKWIALFVGGGLGASLRYVLSAWVDQRMATPFPWGTLTVNFVGSLLIGLIAHQVQQRELVSPTLQLFLIAGILGAFTTFSTFSLETFRLDRVGASPDGCSECPGQCGDLFGCRDRRCLFFAQSGVRDEPDYLNRVAPSRIAD